MMNPIKLLIPLAVLNLSACDFAPATPEERPPLEGATIGGPFELTGSEGEIVNWAGFKGKYRIVYFGFAYCPDICPTDMARIAGGLAMFGKEEQRLADQVQPIFITIDPERDTPEVIAEFLGNFPAGIVGLTGTPEQIGKAADTFGIYYAKSSDAPGGFTHSRIAYLFDPAGEPLATLPTDLGSEAVAAELAKWVR